MTAAEAAGLRDNLIVGFEAFWKGIDEAVSATNKQRKDCYIWQLMPKEDTEYLVDTMLTVAQRVPAAAVVVRAMGNVSHQLRLGSILIPRFVHTWQFYMDAGGFGFGG